MCNHSLALDITRDLIVDFKITAFNLNDRIKPLIIQNYYMDDYREFKYNLSKQSSLSGFSSGENVKITFKAYTNDECAGQTVFTKTISLPYYNMFYHSNDCLEHPDFKYCQSELLTSSVSNRQFYNELQKFLNTNNKNDDEIIDNNNNNNTRFNVNEIIGFVIMIVMILVLIMLIVLKIKKERKKRSL